ncbi:MAG: hypothetical protein HeimC2_39690 [Candidatus Heimdallarchaeota archaeon LC_2]|nr:MAG: hypothetical protein HeimC2_39690 [Candidatus Heimdallarchaeota archaeon LC_2]
MADQDTAKAIKKLQKRQDQLEKENKQLKKRVKELEGKLRVYEGPNSPSSQQPIYRKMKKSPKSDKSEDAVKKPLKKKGQREGHKGSTLVLQSDHEVHDYVSHCSNCHEVVGQDEQRQIYSYQTVEFPQTVSVNIETHHIYEADCHKCDVTTAAEKQPKGTIFAPILASFFSLLWYKGRVPLRSISAKFAALTGYEFSASTIGNCLMSVADLLEKPVDTIRNTVLNSPQVHIDETGYISNITGRDVGWIWSFGTENEVFYEFQESRATTELEEIWPHDPSGTIAIVDGWPAYNYFPIKQRCWEHILWESRDLAIRRGGAAVAADERISLLFHKIKRFKELRPDSRNPIIWHDAVIELEEIIDMISTDYNEDIRSFGNKLGNAKQDLLRALQQPDLPLTNNLAERCLRPLVIHRKIRDFVASERGKQTLMRHATMFETWNLLGNNPNDELLSILTAAS